MFEVVKIVRRLLGGTAADDAARLMSRGRVVDLDNEIALAATMLSVDHGLPMAVRIILATARRFDATLWTHDVDVLGIEGVRYVAKVG